MSHDIRINDFTSGQKIITIDSALLQQYKMQNAAQLLAQQVPVFIKSYGFNGLATLNFRGSSAAQSQVYWNGVPMQNVALGMADVSLLPVSFIHTMQIVYGGSAALLGSGNVGGALLLETGQPRFDSLGKLRYEVGLGTGSFAQHQVAGKISYDRKKWFFEGNVIAQKARNDFSYLYNNLEKHNEHSELRGLSAMLQAARKLNEQNTIRVIAWYQNYDRNIPAALFENYSVKNRKDASLKIFADWNRHFKGHRQYIRASFIKDQMRYDDSAVKLSSDNCSYQYYLEAGWNYKISSRNELLVFTPLQLLQIAQDTTIKNQSRYALAAAYKYNDVKDKLSVSLNARGEVVNKNTIFLPGISASYQLLQWMKVQANLQRTYRAPTLNELYYEPGGNPQLKPENGWAADLGYIIRLQPTARFSIDHDIAAYTRLIDDWIVWFGGAIWTPHNIAQVRSTGIEAHWSFKYRLSKAAFHLSLKGAFTRSVTTQSSVANDGSINRQIPYTPQWLGIINAGFLYAGFSLNYNYVYTGLRYFNTDETGLLPAYQTSNIQLSKDVGLGSCSLQFSVFLNNIFNETYTVVAARPMPGRNASVAVTLKKK